MARPDSGVLQSAVLGRDQFGCIKPGCPSGLRFLGAFMGKEQVNPVIFIGFFSSFFLGFLTFFFDSEPSGTIFHYLNVVRTVVFF